MSITALHAQALQLILLNPGNACYMNALIQVMVWLVTIETLSVTSLASSTGRFYLSLLHNSRLGPINLLHDPRWLSRIEGWAEVHRQHDVCEFFTFLMQSCDCGIFTVFVASAHAFSSGEYASRRRGALHPADHLMYTSENQTCSSSQVTITGGRLASLCGLISWS